MALKPHIVHVVGHTEAHHAATAEDVIEACKLARRAIENALAGAPDMTAGYAACPTAAQRAQELVAEARCDPGRHPLTLAAAAWQSSDPWTVPTRRRWRGRSPSGILDAPQLRNNPFGRGAVVTRIVGGACVAVDLDESGPWRRRVAMAHGGGRSAKESGWE